MPTYDAQELGIPKGLGKKVAGIAIALLVLVVLGGSIGTVGAGQQGVLLRFGAVTDTIFDEGLYFKIPFVNQVVLMSTQIQKYTATATSSSKDLQVVSTDVALNYQLDAAQVGEIYRTMRGQYETRIIQPYIQEAVKSVTANYDAEELITQRPAVKNELQDFVTLRLGPLGMVVVELSITDFQFSAAFQQAIEATQIEDQRVLESENRLKRVKIEAEQEIAKARAEAEGLRLQKQQITAQLLELRKIEVQGRAVEKWNGVMPQVVTSGGPVPMLDVFSAAR